MTLCAIFAFWVFIRYDHRLFITFFIMDFEPAYNRYSLATVNQRLGALIVDFLSCWFIGELVQSLLLIASSSPLRFVIFATTWFIFRVFISARAQGHFAFP